MTVADLGSGTPQQRKDKKQRFAEEVVQTARGVSTAIERTFSAVDNPVRFPSLRLPTSSSVRPYARAP